MRPRDVPGLIHDTEGQLLARLAAETDPSTVALEVGSYRGRSAAYIASGLPAGVPLFCVDAWDLDATGDRKHGFAIAEAQELFELHMRACGFGDRVTAVRALSTDASLTWDERRPIGFAHFDADHSAEGLGEEVDDWWIHLADGAILCFDDYSPRFPGVMSVVDNLGFPVERLEVPPYAGKHGPVPRWLAVVRL